MNLSAAETESDHSSGMGNFAHLNWSVVVYNLQQVLF